MCRASGAAGDGTHIDYAPKGASPVPSDNVKRHRSRRRNPAGIRPLSDQYQPNLYWGMQRGLLGTALAYCVREATAGQSVMKI